MGTKTSLVGRTVTAIRDMTAEELKDEGWPPGGPSRAAIVFDDGTVLYAAQDDEGNGPGAFFGVDDDGGFRITAI